MANPSVSRYLPTADADLVFEEIYARRYRPGMGPLPLVAEFGLDKAGLMKGKFDVWRHRDISLGIRDLQILKPFAIPTSVSNLLSLECMISGGYDLELCGREMRDTGMPRAYLASHTENGHLTRIFNAGDSVRSVGIWLPPAILSEEFGLDLEACSPAIRNIASLAGQFTTTLPLTGRLLGLVRDLIDMQYEGVRAEKFMEAKLLELLCYLCDLLTAPDEQFKVDNKLPRNKSEAMKQVVGILNNNIAAPPRPEELASQVGLSRSTLLSTFKTSYGITITNYLLQRRMDLAQELLRSGKQSILEVGMTVGYEDQSAFGRAYKKYFNRSPKEDRAARSP